MLVMVVIIRYYLESNNILYENRAIFSSYEYRYQALQRCNRLPKTNIRSTPENVLRTLRAFEQERPCHQRCFLSFDVSRATRLCFDVLIDISEYHPLNDAINTFSISIVSLLREAGSKVHLNNPSNWLLQMIYQYLDAGQIASVLTADDIRRPTRDLSALEIFEQPVSVTIFS